MTPVMSDDVIGYNYARNQMFNFYCFMYEKYNHTQKYNTWLVGWLVGFVALRPKSTAMVIAGRSVHLTTLFPGQA